MQTFDISVYEYGSDAVLFTNVINQGIDAHLEAFTESNFSNDLSESRLYMYFAESELSILLRRLLELETDEADLWATDIVYSQYGHETY